MASNTVPQGKFRPAPGTPLVDIPDLPGALRIADEKAAKQALELQELFSQLGKNNADQAAASRAGTLNAAMDTPEIVLFRDTEQLKVDALKSAAKAAAGMSDDASVNVMNIMLQDIRDTGMRMRSVTEKLTQDKSVSLWDDPLTALANAFTIPWDEQQLKGLAAEQSNRVKTLTDLTSGVTNVATAAEAAKAKISISGVADRQRAIAADQERQALQIQAAGMKDGITNLATVAAANAAQLDRVRIATSFWNDIRNQERADEHLRMAREQQAWARLQAADRAKERKDKLVLEDVHRAAEEEMFRLANLARINDGIPPFGSVGEMKSKMITTTAMRERIEDFVERGRRLADPKVAGSYRFGSTAEEAMAYLRNNNLEPRTEQERKFVEVMLAAEAAEKLYKKTSGKEGSMSVMRDYAKSLEKYKSNDGTSPNAPVTFETLLRDPVLQRNPLFQSVIAPKITEGNAKLSAEPNQIFSMLVQASAENPAVAKPAEAAELIKYIYTKSVELNNKNSQIYKYLGYQPQKLVTNISVGANPWVKSASDLTTAAGLAFAATGLGVVPGLTVATVGALGGMHARKDSEVDLSDVSSIQLAFTKKIQSQLGFNLNTTGAFPAGTTPGKDGQGIYPPLLQSSVVTGAK